MGRRRTRVRAERFHEGATVSGLPGTDSSGVAAPGRQGNHQARPQRDQVFQQPAADRKSTRLNSSHITISYAVFCLKKKKKTLIKLLQYVKKEIDHEKRQWFGRRSVVLRMLQTG